MCPSGMLGDGPEALKERVGLDYRNQLSFIEGMKAAIGHDPDFTAYLCDVLEKSEAWSNGGKSR